MKILLQINSIVNSGSTGRITEEISQLAELNGWKSYIAYGRWQNKSKFNLIKIGSRISVYIHGLISLFFDKHGYGSVRATREFLKKVELLKPDIIHLHNIHGYYINIKLLFNYIEKKNIPVVWTLHDCWSITGHCCHFQSVNCNKWHAECHTCPNLKAYPSSLFIDRSTRNYHFKKRLFASSKKLKLIPVCNWLDEVLSNSFLKETERIVIMNGIDLNIFRPKDNIQLTRQSLGIKDHVPVIIAVASKWDSTKGFHDIIAISKMVDSIIIMVGVTKQQMSILPANIIGIERTEDLEKLVDLYSMANVFVNTTYQDTFPTVNIEALACGIPVITYNTGGCKDAVSEGTGYVVERGNIAGVLELIKVVLNKGKPYYIEKCRNRALMYFDKNKRYIDYIKLYDDLYIENSRLNLKN